jgi:hypothetical protein
MRSTKLYAQGITKALIESEKTDRRRTKQHAIDPFFLHSRSVNLSTPEGPEVKCLRVMRHAAWRSTCVKKPCSGTQRSVTEQICNHKHSYQLQIELPAVLQCEGTSCCTECLGHAVIHSVIGSAVALTVLAYIGKLPESGSMPRIGRD